MSPSVWDLAHIGNYEELWLLRAIDGRAAIDPALDDLYNAFEHPRWERPSLPILGPDRGPGLPRPGARPGARPARAASTSTPTRGRRPARWPTASCTAWSCSTSTSTTRRCWPPTSCGALAATPRSPSTRRTRPRRADPPRPGRRRRRTPGADGMCRVDGGPFVMGTSTEPWAYDNERQAPPGRPGRLPHRHHAGHQPRLPGLRRRRRLRRRRGCGPPAGWAWRLDRRPGASPVLAPGPATGAWSVAALRPDARPGRPPRRAGAARLLVRGRRLRPVGRQAPPHRGRVGARPRWARPPAAGRPRWPWGDERAQPDAGQPGPAPATGPRR